MEHEDAAVPDAFQAPAGAILSAPPGRQRQPSLPAPAAAPDAPPNFFKSPVLDKDDYAKALAERDKTFQALELFIDWRHKVMVRFMIATAALAGTWNYLGRDRPELRVVLLLAGACFAVLVAMMDRVNAGHLSRLYERGATLERLMFAGVGVFGAIRNDPADVKRITWDTGAAVAKDVRQARSRRASYTWLLRSMYWATFAFFMIGALLTAVLHLR